MENVIFSQLRELNALCGNPPQCYRPDPNNPRLTQWIIGCYTLTRTAPDRWRLSQIVTDAGGFVDLTDDYTPTSKIQKLLGKYIEKLKNRID